jgi:dihydroorotate dehydrogenase
MYPLLRNILFRFDAEKVHYWSMNGLKLLCRIPGLHTILASFFKPAEKPVQLFGCTFRNPVGLAAGFDKNAAYLRELDILGFGHVEIGTVTPLPQEGNDKPRLFRLPADQAIINRMGFNNDGMETIKNRLATWRRQHPDSNLIIGGNIGKNKNTPNELAWTDYVKCFDTLHPYVDYIIVNVSSPNTPGLRELQDKEALRKIFTELQLRNKTRPQPLPLLLKIAPDLTTGQLDDICSLALDLKLDGLIATNTTLSRENLSMVSAHRAQAIGAGGLSGKPLTSKSNEVVQYLHTHTGGKITLIGSGGIFTATDAREKMQAGAQLVQVWTGFVYEGPMIVKRICQQL